MNTPGAFNPRAAAVRHLRCPDTPASNRVSLLLVVTKPSEGGRPSTLDTPMLPQSNQVKPDQTNKEFEQHFLSSKPLSSLRLSRLCGLSGAPFWLPLCVLCVPCGKNLFVLIRVISGPLLLLVAALLRCVSAVSSHVRFQLLRASFRVFRVFGGFPKSANPIEPLFSNVLFTKRTHPGVRITAPPQRVGFRISAPPGCVLGFLSGSWFPVRSPLRQTVRFWTDFGPIFVDFSHEAIPFPQSSPLAAGS